MRPEFPPQHKENYEREKGKRNRGGWKKKGNKEGRGEGRERRKKRKGKEKGEAHQNPGPSSISSNTVDMKLISRIKLRILGYS